MLLVLTPAMCFWTRTVEDMIVSRLSQVIDVGMGVVTRGARADTCHGFLNSYSGIHDCFKAFTGYWCRYKYCLTCCMMLTPAVCLNSYSGRRVLFSRLSGVIVVGIGIVPHAARAETRHGLVRLTGKRVCKMLVVGDSKVQPATNKGWFSSTFKRDRRMF